MLPLEGTAWIATQIMYAILTCIFMLLMYRGRNLIWLLSENTEHKKFFSRIDYFKGRLRQIYIKALLATKVQWAGSCTSQYFNDVGLGFHPISMDLTRFSTGLYITVNRAGKTWVGDLKLLAHLLGSKCDTRRMDALADAPHWSKIGHEMDTSLAYINMG